MIKHRIWWRVMCLTALAFLLLPRLARAQSQGQVGFQPVTSNVTPGQTFNISLVGSNFQRVAEGGGVNLQFNAARVRVLSVTVDSTTWEFFTQPGTIDNVAGTVSNIVFASFAGRTGNFPIATIRFQALTAGSSTLQLSESSQNPFASGGQILPVTFVSASIVAGAAAAAPLPFGAAASLAFLLAGVGFIWLRRKQLSSTSEKDSRVLS